MENYEYYKNTKKLLEICTGVNFNYILESFKNWINNLSLEEKQKIVIKEYDLFYKRNLFNKYMSDDEKEFRKDLEKELNVEIDSLDWKVTERSEKKWV